MEINEIAATTSLTTAHDADSNKDVASLEKTKQEVKTVEMANREIENTGEQVLQRLESPAQTSKLRVGVVTTLGLNLDIEA